MRILFAITLLFSLTAQSTFAQKDSLKKHPFIDYTAPQSYTLAGIVIKGSNYLSPSVVLGLSGLSNNQKISIPGEEITKAINNLLHQQLYSSVNITLDSVVSEKAYICLNLTSRPRLGGYKFSGPGINKHQRKALKEEINISRTKDYVTEQLLSSVKNKIKEYYNKKGYPSATVEIGETNAPLDSNSRMLDIYINRGSRIKVNSITFVGNDSFSNGKLKRQMSNTKVYQKLNVFRKSKFEKDGLDEDKQSIIDFYRRHGYKDAHIIKDTVLPGKDNRINIKIALEQGHKYYFRNISWSGNTKYNSDYLSSILQIKKGDIYNSSLLERNLFINQNGLDVSSLYLDDGYLFFNVVPVETRIDNDSVDMEIRIFEGPQAIISSVTITGNTKTHDKVILREIRTKPGMKFSRSDILRSQRELLSLGLFNQEKMNVIPTPNAKNGTVALEYVVEEKPSDQIELSGGYGANQLVGVLGLTLNNFSAENVFKKGWQGYPSGDGQRLSLRAQSSGPAFQSYNLSFTNPWFGGQKPNSLTISAFYSVQRYGNIYDPATREQLRSPGGSVGLGKRLKWPDDYFTLFQAVSFQHYIFNNFPLVQNYTNGVSNNLSYRIVLTRNSANDRIFPTSGSLITTSLQITPPYSYFSSRTNFDNLKPSDKYLFIEYHKWKLNMQNFTGLFGNNPKSKFVLMSSAEFGMIGLFNHQLGISPFERFYVGGDGLTGYSIDGRELVRLRGYADYNAVTPAPKDLNGTVIENGGTLYDKFTFELRYPFVNSQVATVYGLAFVEGGNAWQHFNNFNPYDLKRSAGAGIRVFLPMFGLLGFDWGYGFDTPIGGSAPSGSHFHFYIGQPLF